MAISFSRNGKIMLMIGLAVIGVLCLIAVGKLSYPTDGFIKSIGLAFTFFCILGILAEFGDELGSLWKKLF